MSIDLPPVPPTVIEFVGNPKTKHEITYYGEWGNYKIYNVSYPEYEIGEWGLPTLVLYNDNDIHYANPKEQDAILFNINKDY